jgi:hypothetical protein
MSKIKHPREKKLASLTKDHRVYPWDGKKSFRGVWRKKKARMARKSRADFKRALLGVGSGADAPSRSIKQPRHLRKTGVVTLEQHLHIKKQETRARFSTFKYRSSRFKKK